MINSTTLLHPRDHDASQDLEMLVVGEEDHDALDSFMNSSDNVERWLQLDGDRPKYAPFYYSDEHRKADKVPPEVIANAIYNGVYGYLPCYYTELYEDFPLLVAAELAKKIKWYNNKSLRPRYLVEIVRIYRWMNSMSSYGRGWHIPAIQFYGPLAINMMGIYKHTSLSIDLVQEYPKLLNNRKQPESISLYLQCVSKWHMDNANLSTKEISEGIANEWRSILVDSAPILRAAWDSTMTFEQVSV